MSQVRAELKKRDLDCIDSREVLRARLKHAMEKEEDPDPPAEFFARPWSAVSAADRVTAERKGYSEEDFEPEPEPVPILPLGLAVCSEQQVPSSSACDE